MLKQLRKAFFDPSADRKYPHLPARPTDDEINIMLARNNSNCPLNRIIVSPQNEGNFRILHRFCYTAYSRHDHNCRGLSFGIYCPPGQGKTFIVKRFAETMGLPFVFVQSSGLKDTFDLFQQISKVCEEWNVPLIPINNGKANFELPPMIIFFDEAHEIKPDLQRGGLLNPMEPDDGLMHVKEPGKTGDMFVVDCQHVAWIAATTDPADLFDAFRSRFLNSIEWVSAGPDELPEIIAAGLQEKVKKGELPFAPSVDDCRIISRFQSVPRLAIHGFGFQAVMQMRMSNDTWEEACKTVAQDLQIDEWGMTRRQVMILSALGQRTIAKSRLGDICHCRTSQIETMELPGLMQYNNGGPFAISLSGRGMCITEAGQRELDKRNIPHNGRKVTAEFFESRH